MTELTAIIANGWEPVSDSRATAAMKKDIQTYKTLIQCLNWTIMRELQLDDHRNYADMRSRCVEPVRMSLLLKQRFEIEIVKLKMQIYFEAIKFEISYLKKLYIWKIRRDIERGIRYVKNDPFRDVMLKGIYVREYIRSISKSLFRIEMAGFYLYEKNKAGWVHILQMLNHLSSQILCMKEMIFDRKMRVFKIKDIKIDEITAEEYVEFDESRVMVNEEQTYESNYQLKSSSFLDTGIRRAKQVFQAEEEREQNKANGLYFARETMRMKRYCRQYWHLTSEPESDGVQLEGDKLELELPVEGLGDPLGWSKDRVPLFLQIYSVKLTCCSDDVDPDYSVEVSGEISLGLDFPCVPVKPQCLTKKDPYLLLNDLAFIPLFDLSRATKIHVRLKLRSPDEPVILSDEHHNGDLQATRSMVPEDEVYMSGKEFIEGTSAFGGEVKRSTGKHYMLRMTHGIVVNTIVANISVHYLHPPLWQGDIQIIALNKHNAGGNIVLLDSKKVSVTLDQENCFQLLRRRICVDFFASLELYVECFGTCASLKFDPRDCSDDNCDRQNAVEAKIEVQVTWSY